MWKLIGLKQQPHVGQVVENRGERYEILEVYVRTKNIRIKRLNVPEARTVVSDKHPWSIFNATNVTINSTTGRRG